MKTSLVALLIPFTQQREDQKMIWMQRRDTSDFLEGKLEFVGGKIENETAIKACIRETKEEVGVKLSFNKLKFFKAYTYEYKELKVELNCFIYKANMSEFETIGWYELDENFLKKYSASIPEANVDIIKDLLGYDFSDLYVKQV